MKKILKMLCLFALLAAFTLSGAAMAQEVVQSGAAETSVPGLFNAMEKRFSDNDFEMAYELAIQIEALGGQNYSSASLYICYLKAWKAIQADDIDSALIYLSPIIAAKFENSEGYYYYILGRKEQAIGNFNEAVAYYNQASSLGVFNGVSYMAECELAINQNAYAAAERLEQQMNYLQAAQAFEALGVYKDSNERKKACYYAYAGQLVNEMKYAEAVDMYNSLGNYKDSIALAKKYADVANGKGNVFISEASATPLDARSAFISWTDAMQLGGSFTVSWYPGNMLNTAQTKSVSECNIILDELYPNTTYRVIITSDKNAAASAEISFATPQTTNQTGLRVFTHDVLSYEQQDLLSIPLTQLQGSGKARLLENNVIPLPGGSMADSGKGYMLSCSIDRPVTEADELYDYICVVRIGSEYTAATTGQFTVPGYWRYPSLCFDLTTLFDKIYNANGKVWPGTNAVIDLYINNSLLAQSNVMLLNGQ